MKRELMAVIEQIGREKGIDKGRVLAAVESALLTAAKKRYGHGENIQVDVDQETGEISIVSKKTIAETVTDATQSRVASAPQLRRSRAGSHPARPACRVSLCGADS